MIAPHRPRSAAPAGFGVWPRLLHWLLMFAAIAALATAFLAHLPAVRRPIALGWHNAAGLIVWVLVLLLLLWRGFGRAPEPLPSWFAWQAAARRAVTAATYVLLFLVPISGYLDASARGPWIRLLDAHFVPGLPLSEGARALILGGELHGVLALALLAAIAVHLGITLYHHFVLRDRTLERMVDGG